MPTDAAAVAERLRAREDPRLNEDFWRVVSGDGGDVILVGVVHDHPSSCHRVRTLAEEFDPDVVGLELPPLAIPRDVSDVVTASAGTVGENGKRQSGLKNADSPGRSSARGEVRTDGGEDDNSSDGTDYTDRTDRTDGTGGTSQIESVDGGEMGAAVVGSPDSTVVGIDTVGPRFLGRVLTKAWAERTSLGVVKQALSDVVGITRQALGTRSDGWQNASQRGAAAHDVTSDDPATVQADDERAQVTQSQTLLDMFERPEADVLLDETREVTMAKEIESLRTDGSVLAVVGMDHLDSIASDLVS
jgi:hypothetical protein